MTKNTDIYAMTSAARALLADPGRSQLVGDDKNPRFELFHAASSLCSQKVRAVMREKRLSFRSNEMLILGSMDAGELVPAEHYHPAYIRLRLIASGEIQKDFVSGYTGRTSVESEGFDPCVVPLLVDYHTGRVIADSMRICCYIDSVSDGPVNLVPNDDQAREEVMKQVRIVDRIPNGALLYGFHPDDDRRPDVLKTLMGTVYDIKITALQRMIEENPNAPELLSAYRSKIAKESAGKGVCRDEGFQRASRNFTRSVLVGLDDYLAKKANPYMLGESFSLGDVMWGINLVRLAYLGQGAMWSDLANVGRYFEALLNRPSIYIEAVQASMASLPKSVYLERVAERIISTSK